MSRSNMNRSHKWFSPPPTPSPLEGEGRVGGCRGSVALRVVLPLVLLVGGLVAFAKYGANWFEAPPAPIENIYLERLTFKPEEISVVVMNVGPEPVTIAQAFVNEMLVDNFAISPSATIPRLGRAVLSVGHSWVKGDPYEVAVMTSNGFVFHQEAGVAKTTPVPTTGTMALFALLGLYVGVIPVFLGMLWRPFLRTLAPEWMQFLLSLTVGLLVFLGVDSLHEGLEAAEQLAGPHQGVMLTIGLALLSALGLVAVGSWLKRRHASEDESRNRWTLALMIAVGIGLHNLGEGLAIGAAYAIGEVGLGIFLVIGFTLHNTTEGLGIVAPLAKDEVKPSSFIGLGLAAGAPTIVGAWIGGFAYSPLWATVCLALGAGAIFQVVYELSRFMIRQQPERQLLPVHVGGIASGMMLMYLTGLMVK